MNEDRFVGAMLGLALGDALGSPHEGSDIGGRPPKDALSSSSDLLRWTDDTQMAIGLAESLIECDGLDPDHLARRFADRAELRRGYGGGAWRLLSRIRNGENWRVANRAIFANGSFGNGGAMRAAPLGLWFALDLESLREQTELATSITHFHPHGLEAAVLIARATAYALAFAHERKRFDSGDFLAEMALFTTAGPYRQKLEKALSWVGRQQSAQEIVHHLGNSVLALDSTITALFMLAEHHDNYESLMRGVIALGGDTDTIGAMAGGVFGALRGANALPVTQVARLEESAAIAALGRAIHARRG